MQLPTMKRVELIDKRGFIAAAVKENAKNFVVYGAALLATLIYLSRKQHVGALIYKIASTEVLAKYLKYADMFLPDLAIELPKCTRINNYAMNLIEEEKLLYSPIYSLCLMELEMLKTYIETDLKTRFTSLFKFPLAEEIFFD